jgi:hypothetical protein
VIKAPSSLSFAAFDGQAAEELKGSFVAERLMRADGVVDAFTGTGLAIDGVDGPGGERPDFIELLGVSALGAFDRAIELGRAGRDHEQAQPISLLASETVPSVPDAQRAQRNSLGLIILCKSNFDFQ